MNTASSRSVAFVLIGLGVFLLLIQTLGWDLPLGWSTLWPLVLLVPGLLFHAAWAGDRRA